MIHYQQIPAKQKIECIDFFSIIEFIQFGCWQLLRHKIDRKLNLNFENGI